MVFFRHKYITQPVVTQTDAILRATDDLISVLKGKKVIKGATRSAIAYSKATKASQPKLKISEPE